MPNLSDRFTAEARDAWSFTQKEAAPSLISPEHLLLGLLRAEKGIAGTLLKELGIDLDAARTVVGANTSGKVGTIGKLGLTPTMKRVIEFAVLEAMQRGLEHVGTEQLLLGLLREEESTVTEVLAGAGLSREDVRQRLLEVMQSKWSS